MQLNRRQINVLLRLTLSLFAIIVCAFVLFSPYVVRTFESNAGVSVHITVNTAFAKPVCGSDGTGQVVIVGSVATCADGSTPVQVPDDFSKCPAGTSLGTNLALNFVGSPCIRDDSLVDADPYISTEMGVIEYFTSGAFLISITGVLLAFSGWILNSSIEYFIVDMGKYLGSGTPMGDAIVQSWTIIRDIINLTFVFGLIYLAFMTIAKADTAKLKHGIANILIGALLINFSIFFGKAIIDISNVTAVEIYQQMSEVQGASGQTINVGISGFFAGKLGIPTTINPIELLNSEQGTVDLGVKAGKFGFGFSIFVSLIFLVASFVFLAGGILIAIRFIVLALLLILSPIAFAFAFLPKIHTEEWSRMWWDRIVAQALFAPAYLLLLYIAMNVANVSTLVAGGSIIGFFSGEAGNSIGAFMNFVLIIGFLVGAIIIAKKMGAYGATTAASWGKSARMYGQRTLGGATAGVAAVAGRRTFGRLGLKYSNSDTLKDLAAQGGLKGIAARRALGLSRTAEKASFDLRQVGGVGKQLGVGEGKTGGYKQTLEDVKKKDEEYAKLLGTVDDTDPQVLALKAAQKRDEEKLASLKNEKDVEKAKGDKADLAKLNKFDHDIHEQEEKIEKAKKAVDQEKNRRQIGSAVTAAEAKDAEFARLGTNVKNSKKIIEDLAKKLVDEKDPKIAETRRQAIRDAQKAIEEIEKQQKERLTVLRQTNGITTGYAGYIESYSKGTSGAVWSAVYGRNRQMNKKSSEELRDTYKKKDKEKKEPKKKDAKPAAEKKEEKHDDHGGDDHGH